MSLNTFAKEAFKLGMEHYCGCKQEVGVPFTVKEGVIHLGGLWLDYSRDRYATHLHEIRPTVPPLVEAVLKRVADIQALTYIGNDFIPTSTLINNCYGFVGYDPIYGNIRAIVELKRGSKQRFCFSYEELCVTVGLC